MASTNNQPSVSRHEDIEKPSVSQDSNDLDEITANDENDLRQKLNAKLNNPLAGFSHDELGAKGETYCRDNSIGEEEDIRAFRLGAIIAQDPNKHAECAGLTEDERATLSKEIESKWSQPKLLYLIVVLCSTCAAVQGMVSFSYCLYLVDIGSR